MVKRKFYRGDTVYFNIAITDDAGSPVDLTGATVYFTMKKNIDDPDPGDLQKAITTHTDPTQGKTQIKLDSSDTDNIDPGKYFYDFQVTLANGDKITIESGILEVLADVTRA